MLGYLEGERAKAKQKQQAEKDKLYTQYGIEAPARELTAGDIFSGNYRPGIDTYQGKVYGADPNVVTQQPLQTSEQKLANALLIDSATKDKYQPTTNETTTSSKIAELLGLNNLATKEFTDLLGTDKYNPYSDTGVYSGLKRGIEEEYQNSVNQLKNTMAYSGNLYSTAMNQEVEKLGRQKSEKLSDILANLYDTYGQRRLAGASSLNSMNIGNIDTGLNESQLKYNEWLNSEGRKLSALSAVSGAPVQWGVQTMPVARSYQPSDFEKFLDAVSKIGSTVATFAAI